MPLEETTWNRRDLMTLAGAATAVAVIPQSLRAIEPIARCSSSPLKLSLAAYSLRTYFGLKPGEEGAIDMPGFIAYCAHLGFDAAEPTQYFFPNPVDRAFILKLKRQAHLAGIDISGGAIGNNFTLAPGKSLDDQMEYTKTWINHYADLGAPVIRVFAGAPPEGVSVDQAIERAIANLQQACEFAGERGVMLAVENHDFGEDIDRLMQIVQQVDSPWFGVNFDSGNFSKTNDPYRAMKRMAPYAVNAQLKVLVRGPDREEATDLPRVVRILQEADYSGYLVLEYEGYEDQDDPYSAIPRYLDQLRTLLRG